MNFHTLKRRDLQTLCKKNNIQANMTNAAMTDALVSLDTVEGVEEFLRQSESVITSPNVSLSSTCQRTFKDDVECSKLATRSRCGARSIVAKGTETKQTPATRTTRRRAQKEPSIQRKMEEDMQAQYEADLEQSEITENKPGDLSGVMDQEGHVSSENQNEPQDQVYEQKEHLKEDHVLNEDQEVLSTEMLNDSPKVDFHNLSRKELQNLCKRNKIPANTTSAAMAEALEALESVEGLEDLLKEYDPLAAKSPEMSRVPSSRVRQTRTCQKTTRRKATQAGSALGKIESVQKKEDSVVQKMDLSMEDREFPVSISTAEDVLSMEVEKDMQSHLEASPEKPEVPDCVSKNSCGISESKSLSEEVSDESDASIVVETGKELQHDVVDNKFDGGEKESTETELCDSSADLESNVNGLNDADDELKPVTDQFPADVLGLKESNLSETEDTLQEDALENEADGHEEVNANYCEESDNGGGLKSDTLSSDELYVGEGLIEAPGGGNGAFEEYDDILSDLQEDKFRLEDDDGKEFAGVGLNIENLEQLGNTNSERDGIVFEDMSVADSNVVPEDLSDMVNVESVSKCATQQDEDLNFVSASVKFSNEAQEISSLEIHANNESAKCQQEEDQMTKKFYSESTTQADEHAPKVKGTPLCHKSLRKLKRMLKEKLQATTLLTTKMENLTLEESEIPLGSNTGDTDAETTKKVPENMKEGCEEIKEVSDEFSILAVSGVDADAPISAVISSGTANDDLDRESKENVIDTTESNDNGEVTSVFKDEVSDQVATSIVVDHEISQDIVVDLINIETVNCDRSNLKPEESFDQGEKQSSELVPLKQVVPSKSSTTSGTSQTESDNINCLHFTPCKSLRKTQKPLLTPSKSSSKTSTMSALDIINKENIDNSSSKTLPGKMEIAVAGSGKILSAMSMGKLKKEFKVLQQQSEKKRPALQSCSENRCPLASP